MKINQILDNLQVCARTCVWRDEHTAFSAYAKLNILHLISFSTLCINSLHDSLITDMRRFDSLILSNRLIQDAQGSQGRRGHSSKVCQVTINRVCVCELSKERMVPFYSCFYGVRVVLGLIVLRRCRIKPLLQMVFSFVLIVLNYKLLSSTSQLTFTETKLMIKQSKPKYHKHVQGKLS